VLFVALTPHPATEDAIFTDTCRTVRTVNDGKLHYIISPYLDQGQLRRYTLYKYSYFA
jgi:hypothetical protein